MTRTRVLVTGADGHLGTALIRRLATRDDLALARLVSPRSTAVPEGTVRVELADHALLASTVEGLRPDVVLHLASINGAACDLDPALTRAVNVGATAVLAAAARRAGTGRFVHVSSASVYGTGYERPILETDELLGESLYGRSKAEAEAALAGSAGDSDMTSVSLRVFNLYGPAFIHSLITRLENSQPSEPVGLVGLDRFRRDYVHVDDVVESVLSAMDATLPAPHSTFNVGSGRTLSNREVVELLERNGPVHYAVEGDQVSASGADISEARRVLHFAPRRAVGDTPRTAQR